MNTLIQLLKEVSENRISANEIECQFDRIADNILNRQLLVSTENKYKIREIEFYLNSINYKHKDVFSHSFRHKKESRQGTFGEWYFHRYTTTDTYKRQKFKGVDITFGNKQLNNFGGILIRKIENVKTNKILSGIANIVNLLLEEIGEENFDKIAKNINSYVFNEESPLKLEENPQGFKNKFYKAPRILPLSNDEKNYRLKLYRYFNDVEIKEVII